MMRHIFWVKPNSNYPKNRKNKLVYSWEFIDWVLMPGKVRQFAKAISSLDVIFISIIFCFHIGDAFIFFAL